MPEYIVNTVSLIGGRLVQPGTKVDFDGLPGKNLTPTDKAGEKMKAKRADMLKPVSPEERMGAAIAEGINNPKKASRDVPGSDDEPEVTAPAVGAVSTVGHTSVTQKSAGGVDAENLLKTSGDGKSEPQNPNSDAAPAKKADSPDDGAPKVDADGNPAVVDLTGETTAVTRKRK